jgi:putative membrane protein
MERSKRAALTAIVGLAFFHEVGVAGLNLDATRELFQQVTPLNLLLSAVVVGWFHRVWNVQFGIWAFAIFWAGYLVEVLGVWTGYVFGVYSYGGALGPHIARVPPLIGLNWLILSYSAGIAVMRVRGSIWLRSTLGAAMLTGLDVLMEQVAPGLGFWQFQDNVVPLQNYFAWFVIAWGMQYSFHSLEQEKRNAVAPAFFVIQVLFFLSNLVINL